MMKVLISKIYPSLTSPDHYFRRPSKVHSKPRFRSYIGQIIQISSRFWDNYHHLRIFRNSHSWRNHWDHRSLIFCTKLSMLLLILPAYSNSFKAQYLFLCFSVFNLLKLAFQSSCCHVQAVWNGTPDCISVWIFGEYEHLASWPSEHSNISDGCVVVVVDRNIEQHIDFLQKTSNAKLVDFHTQSSKASHHMEPQDYDGEILYLF